MEKKIWEWPGDEANQILNLDPFLFMQDQHEMPLSFNVCIMVKWERVWYLFTGVRGHWGSKNKNVRIRPQTCSYIAGGNSYTQSVEHEVS